MKNLFRLYKEAERYYLIIFIENIFFLSLYNKLILRLLKEKKNGSVLRFSLQAKFVTSHTIITKEGALYETDSIIKCVTQ